MAGHTELMVGAPVAATFSRSVDHVSRFLGLAVSNLYLLAAACTLWEVIARYVFNSPTQWVFEVVMVLCASSWMLSAGFVTLRKRHIGITVFYLMASDRVRWWLDLFAMVVGVFALYMLVSDTLIRALESIDLTRSEEHTSELQSHHDLVCRLLLEKKKKQKEKIYRSIVEQSSHAHKTKVVQEAI